MGPAGFLVVNVILHVLNTWLVYLIGRRLFSEDRWAAVAAVVYGIHPVNAEAVNYVVARSSLLSSLGGLVAFWALLRRDEGMPGGFAISVSAFGLALLSKETAIALVPPLVVKNWLLRRETDLPSSLSTPPASAPCGWRHGLWSRDAPIVLVFVGVSILFIWFWKTMTAGRSLMAAEGGAMHPSWTFVEMMCHAFRLWIWPWPLGLNHPLTFVRGFDPVTAVGCVAMLGALTVLAARSVKRSPFVTWCLLWTVAGLLPMAPLPWLTTRALFQENRLSFSAIGLAWLTAWVAQALWHKYAPLIDRFAIVRAISLGAAGLVVVGAVLVDRYRSWVWNDSVRLWEEVVSRRADDHDAYANLGMAYFFRRDLERAETAFRRAMAIEPRHWLAPLNVGLILQERGRWDALTRWDFMHLDGASIEHTGTSGHGAWRDPQNVQHVKMIRFALAYSYLNHRNDLLSAQSLYEAVTREDVADFRAWYNLGAVAERRGLTETARNAYRHALALSPNETNIALALQRLEGG
jgi:tetratricopeptide (TPR) repeat protein